MKWIRRIKDYPNLLFFAVFLLLCALYYPDMIDQRPMSVHMWRQSDCLSIAHWYAEGASLLEPQIHLQLADGLTSGRTAGEFPGLYYTVGWLWKIAGESYLSYRLLYLFILFLGTLCLFRILLHFLRDLFWAMAITLLVSSSPVYAFYGISFLTDVPAIAFNFIAFYFLLVHPWSRWNLVWFTLFIALAGLIKVTSLILFVALSVLVLWNSLIKPPKRITEFRFSLVSFWVSVLAIIVLVGSWYLYADQYNQLHRFKFTINTIHPFWDVPKHEITQFYTDFVNYTSTAFLSRPLWLVLIISFVYNLTLVGKIPWSMYVTNILVLIGGLVYAMLWLPLLGIHDYYFAALLIWVPVFLSITVFHLKQNYPTLFRGAASRILVGLFVAFNIYYCDQVLEVKTAPTDREYAVIGNDEYRRMMSYVHRDTHAMWDRLDSIQPFLATHGIDTTTRVLFIPDPSFNLSLYLLDRKGWTNYLQYSTSEQIENLIAHGAEYLFIGRDDFLEKDFLQPFMHDKVGSYKGIQVYRLGVSNTGT
jgi:hypothetical protein